MLKTLYKLLGIEYTNIDPFADIICVNGEIIKKTFIHYITDNTICDSCDKKTKVACIRTLGKDYINLCKNCLDSMKNAL